MYTIVTDFIYYLLVALIQFHLNRQHAFLYITGPPGKPKRTNRRRCSSAKEADDVASTGANLSGDDDPPANSSGNEEREGKLLMLFCQTFSIQTSSQNVIHVLTLTRYLFSRRYWW